MAKILVVEDELPILENILDILELEGHQVLGAHDGRAGLELARQHLPDLIVSDIMMPEMDGYGLLLALREDSATATIPLVFLTAKADRSAMRQGMELGADDYLTKPFTPAELVALVNARLERRATVAQEYEKKMEDLRGNLFRMLPHELRTPLATVIGYSELILYDAPDLSPKRLISMVESIHQAGLRLHRLIENFLMHSQIELLKTNPALLKQMQAMWVDEPDAIIRSQAKRTADELDRQTDLALLMGDQSPVLVATDSLKKIVLEVVENAFKFSEPGQPVEVEAGVENSVYCLRVRDHGRGMTPEQIASIGAGMQFERALYEQQGAGLGLIIALRLADLHNGALTIDSRPNDFTAVQVTLPLRI
jgi:two-component system sensor histidine kinase/response regulator